jgi:hypothetical protein
LIDLRDYKRKCLKAAFEYYRAGIPRQLVCLPTGSGNTVVFAGLPRYFRMKNRMLVLAHRGVPRAWSADCSPVSAFMQAEGSHVTEAYH